MKANKTDNALITEFNEVKRCLLRCPEVTGLDEGTAAALFWRGEAQTSVEGQIIYAEGTMLDNTFCVLLSGQLLVEKAGEVIIGITEGEVFGEMAYFTDRKTRTATVRVASPQAAIFKFRLTPKELADARFSALRRSLALQTWDKFVSASQLNPLSDHAAWGAGA
jgi:hypothetical protein